MGKTEAIMFTATTFGTWLRGDQRGWVEDGIVRPPDPELEAADVARMKHPPYRFDRARLLDVGEMICRSLIDRLDQIILALTVQTWHVHVVVTATPVDVADVVKCFKEAARYGLRPGRPIWTDGYDKRFCFDETATRRRVNYVLQHNERMGWGLMPTRWRDFITPLEAHWARVRTT